MKIKTGTYENPENVGFRGWAEPEDGSWIVFVRLDGSPVLFSKREPSGAVVD